MRTQKGIEEGKGRLDRYSLRGDTLIEACLNKDSKRAHQLVRDLNSEEQGRSTTIQDRSGKFLKNKRSQQMARILL